MLVDWENRPAAMLFEASGATRARLMAGGTLRDVNSAEVAESGRTKTPQTFAAKFPEAVSSLPALVLSLV